MFSFVFTLPMEVFQRNRNHFRFCSLPLTFVSKIRSWSLERRSSRYYSTNSPALTQRRNAISAQSYNDVRKRIINRRIPTIVLNEFPTKEIYQSDLDLPIAASSHFILTFVNRCSTLILFDECRGIFRLDLRDELIYLYDLCWSTKLNCFLLAGYSLYTFDPRSFQFSIRNESNCSAEWIVSLTSNDQFVYLLYSSRSTRLERRSLFSLNQIDRQWMKNSFLRQNDFLAQSIRHNQWNVIAFLIRNRSGQWRVDLFHSNDLQRIFSGDQLGQTIPTLRNSFLISYERMWIVLNNSFRGDKIILLDQTSRIHSTNSTLNNCSKPLNLCFVGTEWILVNRRDRLSFYSIERTNIH